ncbi:MAG: DNA methyltransferase [bacterium]|nr:DNA methyltransferase [bacterium]
MSAESYYRHDAADRINLPTEETPADPTVVERIRYQTPRRPGTDPVLAWDRETRNGHDAPVLSVREKVHPQAFLEQMQNGERGTELNLFDDYNGLPADRDIFEHYRHRHNWQNRLISGESARVMSSLITREDLAGRVQVVYFDPPYGIGFRSNFQTATNNLNTGDSKSDVPVGNPATISAFRDTYRNGIHSYLDAMLERLLLIRELLADTGSVFVQIGDDNVHRMALVCDEVFGPENKMATITWKPTSGSSSKTLPESASYLLWYAKDKEQATYHQVYEQLSRKDIAEYFSWAGRVEVPNEKGRPLTKQERADPDVFVPSSARIYRIMALTSQGASNTGRTCWYEYDGVKYHSGDTRQWRVSTPQERTHTNGAGGETRASGVPSAEEKTRPSGLDRLAELGRLEGTGTASSDGALSWKWYEDEVPGRRIDNVWHNTMRPLPKRYVVETAASVIERCILMASDPGDLVLDPTCGSGVTADTAERWGRRWITIDTSPVAVAVARQRLLTGAYPWWNLAREDSVDPAVGFDYQTIQRVSAATLAYDTVNDPENTIVLVDRPREDRKKLRVAGPFTVETESPYSYAPFSDPTNGADDIGLATTADRVAVLGSLEGAVVLDGDGNPSLTVAELEPWPDAHLTTHGVRCQAPGRDTEFMAALMIANPDATVSARQVSRAVSEAREHLPDERNLHLVVVGWAFAPDIAPSYRNVPVLRIQANRDLLIGQLKPEDAGSSYTLLGEPDLCVHPEEGGKVSVEVLGYDTYDPSTGGVTSGGSRQIAAWMIDTRHDGESFYSTLIYLPAAENDRRLKKLLKALKKTAADDALAQIISTRSQPFEPTGQTVAVKIITTTGAEMTKILPTSQVAQAASLS